MVQKLKRSLTGLSAALLMMLSVNIPAVVSAQDIQGNLCAGASLNVNTSSGCSDTSSGSDRINNIIHSIINIFSLVVGVVAVFMIIVAGFRYITSGGASDNVSGAKNTIIYAIIGLVIVALAQFIVQFVLNKVTTTGN